jgi:hypothetical protein
MVFNDPDNPVFLFAAHIERMAQHYNFLLSGIFLIQALTTKTFENLVWKSRERPLLAGDLEELALHKLQEYGPGDDDGDNRKYAEYKRYKYQNGRAQSLTFSAVKALCSGIFGDYGQDFAHGGAHAFCLDQGTDKQPHFRNVKAL